jgi:hypothetical protein
VIRVYQWVIKAKIRGFYPAEFSGLETSVFLTINSQNLKIAMKKIAIISIIIALSIISHAAFAQNANNANNAKWVKVYLKSSSLLPRGVGIKEINPNGKVEVSYRGNWMPFTRNIWEVPVGTRLEYIADKSVIMSGKAADYKGKLIVEVKAADGGKTFTF